MHIRHAGAVVVAAGLLLGTAGCNSTSQDTAGPSGGTSQQAAPRSLTMQDFARVVSAAQAKAGSAHVQAKIKMSGQVATFAGDVSGLKSPGNVAMDMTVKASGTTIAMIVMHKVIYLKGTGMTRSPGKPWMKIDLSDANNPLGSLFQSANPGNFTAYLNGVQKFKDLGRDTMDGVPARRYAVTVDTKTMLAQNPTFKGQDMSSLGLPKRLTSNIWVDRQNRLVRLSLTMGSAGSFQADFSRYGEPVSVHAPAASKVAPFHL